MCLYNLLKPKLEMDRNLLLYPFALISSCLTPFRYLKINSLVFNGFIYFSSNYFVLAMTFFERLNLINFSQHQVEIQSCFSQLRLSIKVKFNYLLIPLKIIQNSFYATLKQLVVLIVKLLLDIFKYI